jgi:hypothetical protein
VHVYNFSSPPEKISVSETTDNPLGLCCLSSKLLAYPGRTPGQVQLVEIETGNVTIVPAHATALRAIEISPDGEIMATASEAVGVHCFVSHRRMGCLLMFGLGYAYPNLCHK